MSLRGKTLPAALLLAAAVAVAGCGSSEPPKTFADSLAKHQVTGKMRYLIGARKALEKVWLRWGIVAKPDPKTPNAVEHSGLVYGIAASGKITTLYPANFKPADIVHDVPILAAH